MRGVNSFKLSVCDSYDRTSVEAREVVEQKNRLKLLFMILKCRKNALEHPFLRFKFQWSAGLDRLAYAFILFSRIWFQI